ILTCKIWQGCCHLYSGHIAQPRGCRGPIEWLKYAAQTSFTQDSCCGTPFRSSKADRICDSFTRHLAYGKLQSYEYFASLARLSAYPVKQNLKSRLKGRMILVCYNSGFRHWIQPA